MHCSIKSNRALPAKGPVSVWYHTTCGKTCKGEDTGKISPSDIMKKLKRSRVIPTENPIITGMYGYIHYMG